MLLAAGAGTVSRARPQVVQALSAWLDMALWPGRCMHCMQIQSWSELVSSSMMAFDADMTEVVKHTLCAPSAAMPSSWKVVSTPVKVWTSSSFSWQSMVYWAPFRKLKLITF